MERDSPWATLANAVGAAGALVGLVYATGGLVLSMRYDGFGLNGQEAAALAPRERLLFSGATSLVRWLLIGLAALFAVRLLLRVAPQVKLTAGRAAVLVAAIALALALLPRVIWPLAAFVAVVVVVVAERRASERPIVRLLTASAAVALVAVAYEADRLTYRLNWSCVTVVRGPERCGILVAHTDRGVYVGAPAGGAGPHRLVFLPAARVVEAVGERRTTRVTAQSAEDRRRTPAERLWRLRIR